MKTFARYLAFQVPAWGIAGIVAWALVVWDVLAWPWVVAGLVAYAAKDLFLFRFVRKAYEHEPHDPMNMLASREGVAVSVLDPEGWVQVGSERWRAEQNGQPAHVAVGEKVRILGMRGHTLRVEPARAVVVEPADDAGQPIEGVARHPDPPTGS